MNVSSFKNAFHATVLVISVALLLSTSPGCTTTSSGQRSAVQLSATGDAGIEFDLVVTRGGAEIQRQTYTVPAEVSLEGRNLDVLCVHRKQPGNLAVRVTRDGLSVSVSSTYEPGSVSEFKVRGNEIGLITRTARAATAASTKE